MISCYILSNYLNLVFTPVLGVAFNLAILIA